MVPTGPHYSTAPIVHGYEAPGACKARDGTGPALGACLPRGDTRSCFST